MGRHVGRSVDTVSYIIYLELNLYLITALFICRSARVSADRKNHSGWHVGSPAACRYMSRCTSTNTIDEKLV